MEKFISYLRDVKKAVTTQDTPIRLAMGNTSGDMDSITGAMGLAYYLTLKTGESWTPVVNCARADFKLKTEIYCHLIDDCKLCVEDMFFWDELLELSRQIKEIALIDHNLIDEVQAE